MFIHILSSLCVSVVDVSDVDCHFATKTLLQRYFARLFSSLCPLLSGDSLGSIVFAPGAAECCSRPGQLVCRNGMQHVCEMCGTRAAPLRVKLMIYKVLSNPINRNI